MDIRLLYSERSGRQQDHVETGSPDMQNEARGGCIQVTEREYRTEVLRVRFGDADHRKVSKSTPYDSLLS